MSKVPPIEERIGYGFADRSLLRLALTHKSAEGPQVRVHEHNERLEHLGDAVLGFLTAEVLYNGLPLHDEGVLTRIRSRLVNTRALVTIAVDIGLPAEMRSANAGHRYGYARHILADCVEALLGAVYCDGGMPAARAVFATLWGEKAKAAIADPAAWAAPDPKTTLQEHLQGTGRRPPVYKTVHTERIEELDLRVFNVECRIGDLVFAGRGANKQDAEQDAALRAFYELTGANEPEARD